MTDYDTLKDILETSELLSNELEDSLEVTTFNEQTGRMEAVVFKFNKFKELEGIVTENS